VGRLIEVTASIFSGIPLAKFYRFIQTRKLGRRFSKRRIKVFPLLLPTPSVEIACALHPTGKSRAAIGLSTLRAYFALSLGQVAPLQGCWLGECNCSRQYAKRTIRRQFPLSSEIHPLGGRWTGTPSRFLMAADSCPDGWSIGFVKKYFGVSIASGATGCNQWSWVLSSRDGSGAMRNWVLTLEIYL